MIIIFHLSFKNVNLWLERVSLLVLSMLLTPAVFDGTKMSLTHFIARIRLIGRSEGHARWLGSNTLSPTRIEDEILLKLVFTISAWRKIPSRNTRFINRHWQHLLWSSSGRNPCLCLFTVFSIAGPSLTRQWWTPSEETWKMWAFWSSICLKCSKLDMCLLFEAPE